jgi:hypothetical protein
MKRGINLPMVLMLSLTTLSWNISDKQQSSVSLALADSKTAFVPSWLIEVRGRVEYKRTSWSKYQPAQNGTELYPGDLLRLTRGAVARVRCASGRRWRVPDAGESGLNNGCPPVLRQGRGLTDLTRGGQDLTIPFIISPRSTRLLTDKPLLRWNAVSGAKRYSVSVLDLRVGKGEVWKTEVSGTEVLYAGQPLEPGVDYLLVVKTDNGWSSEEETEQGTVGLGFRLLDPAAAQRVRTEFEQIKQELTGESAELAIAHLYIASDLRAEAIEQLEALATKGSQTAASYRILGALYRQVGLNRLSEDRYIKAAQMAKKTGDLETQAIAQAGLGELYAARRNWDEAIRWGTAAKAGYEQLGDGQRVSELNKLLERWQRYTSSVESR